MKRKIRLLMTATIFILLLAFSPVRVNFYGELFEVKAAERSVQNPEEINLYFLDDSYKSVIGNIPSGYMTSFQIDVSGLQGTPSYSVVSGDTAEVSSNGVITPKATIWYWKNGVGTSYYVEGAEKEVTYKQGLTTIRVTCGDYSQDISVHVISYATTYAENKMDRILAEIITDGMSQLEQLNAVTQWIGENTDYNYRYQSWQAMMIYEGGDCWASTNTIVAMCEKLGIDARSRRGNQDPGAGSGHYNVVAKIDGKYYIAEAGSSGDRPRYWNVSEEPGGFSVSGSTIYQYDGDDPRVVVPSEINGTTITGFGNGKATVFVNKGTQSVELPSTITTIGRGAFSEATQISEIKIASDNSSFCIVDGILYSADRKTLVFVPPSTSSFVIDSNTEEIECCAISGCNLDRLVIPSNVKKINNSAFMDSSINELIIEEGLETLENYAFYGLTTPKIIIPASITTMGPASFYYCYADEIILSEGMGVTEIPESAFQDSSIKKMTIPEGVTSIGKAAFRYCYYLSELTIPTTVTDIGENAFQSCSKLKNIYYKGSESQWNNVSMASQLPSGITVRFSSIRVTGLEASENSITLTQQNQTADLAVKVLPEDASNKDVTFESDNTRIATVSGNVVKAVSEGECNVTATSADGGYQVTFKIIVRYPRYKLTLIDAEIISTDNAGKTEAEYKEGSFISIKANKKDNADGLEFKNWECEGGNVTIYGSSRSSAIQLRMPDHDLTITAVYGEPEDYTTPIWDNPGDNQNQNSGNSSGKSSSKKSDNNKKQKLAQTMVVKTAKKTVKYSKSKKKAVKVKPVTVTAAHGTLRYEICGGKAKARKALKINAKTGKITVKKRTKKGTYKVKVKVTAAGNNQYNSGSKTVKVTIRVK